MVVPDVVVLQTVDFSKPAHVIVHLVDELWMEVRCLNGEHVGDVVAGAVDELS